MRALGQWFERTRRAAPRAAAHRLVARRVTCASHSMPRTAAAAAAARAVSTVSVVRAHATTSAAAATASASSAASVPVCSAAASAPASLAAPATSSASSASTAAAAASGASGASGSVTASARDRILLKGLTFHGFHGAFAAEKQLGQKFVVDAELTCDLRRPGESDELGGTVDYAHVFNTIKRIVEGPGSDALIERVADRIARAVLSGDFGSESAGAAASASRIRIERVRVVVKKPHVAVAGVVEYLGVELVRTRADYGLP